MEAARPESKKYVAVANVARQNLISFGSAKHKAGQIEIADSIQAWHLGSFSSYECTPRGPAALRNSRNNSGSEIRFDLAHGQIIEKEQGGRTMAYQVVDAHRDKIDTDAGDVVGLDGDAQLGANSIGSGYQDRVCKTRLLEVEEPCESADLGNRSGPSRFRSEGSNVVGQGVPGLDIDSCVLVGQWHDGSPGDAAVAGSYFYRKRISLRIGDPGRERSPSSAVPAVCVCSAGQGTSMEGAFRLTSLVDVTIGCVSQARGH